jgi:hypothetical protein
LARSAAAARVAVAEIAGEQRRNQGKTRERERETAVQVGDRGEE